jgi:ribosomal protein S18 acetylase RimI-like enzyme
VGNETVQVQVLTNAADVQAHRDDVWAVLEKTDQEYFPPLSRREAGAIDQPPLIRKSLWPQPVDYFNEILKEHVLLASIGGKMVGMITYVPRFESKTISAVSPCTYLDTVGVIPGYRRHGIATMLYKSLFEQPTVQALEHVALRTWSTNVSHMGLLEKLGFDEIERHVDERAPGVDTVYFARKSAPSPFE